MADIFLLRLAGINADIRMVTKAISPAAITDPTDTDKDKTTK